MLESKPRNARLSVREPTAHSRERSSSCPPQRGCRGHGFIFCRGFSSTRLIFLDFPRISNMFFDFHALFRYVLTFGKESPAKNKTMAGTRVVAEAGGDRGRTELQRERRRGGERGAGAGALAGAGLGGKGKGSGISCSVFSAIEPAFFVARPCPSPFRRKGSGGCRNRG